MTRPARVFGDMDAFCAVVGEELGTSDWFEVTQERIDVFADVTEDWQWIHVDPERAAAGPYGGTVAHGYLTLSLIPRLGGGIFRIEGTRMQINYGLDTVRFPAPVRAGDRIRARATLARTEPAPGGVRAIVRYSIEIEGSDRPACVADTVRVIVRS